MLSEATRVSIGVAGRKVAEKKWWASLLYTRMCTMGLSLLSLAPRSRLAGRTIELFDFSSVASLTRNLAECYLVFFYIGIDVTDEDEWLTRLNLLQLHDCMTRVKMFNDFNTGNPQLPELKAQADELRARLQTRKHFTSLPPRQQKKFLAGDHAWMVIQDDLLARMEVNVGRFRGYYRFLSSHTHSFPVAFYRMPDREQGRGVESEWERGMISMALEFTADAFSRATKNMYELFPDIGPKVETGPAA